MKDYYTCTYLSDRAKLREFKNNKKATWQLITIIIKTILLGSYNKKLDFFYAYTPVTILF